MTQPADVSESETSESESIAVSRVTTGVSRRQCCRVRVAVVEDAEEVAESSESIRSIVATKSVMSTAVYIEAHTIGFYSTVTCRSTGASGGAVEVAVNSRIQACRSANRRVCESERKE
jgi:hypothetical protein